MLFSRYFLNLIGVEKRKGNIRQTNLHPSILKRSKESRCKQSNQLGGPDDVRAADVAGTRR
jgi:hypothetical protein